MRQSTVKDNNINNVKPTFTWNGLLPHTCTYDLIHAIPLLGIYPEDVPTSKKDTCFTMFIEALFIIARSWKDPRCPSIMEWIPKMWYIYAMEYCSAIKKIEFIKFLDKWMEL